MVRLHLLLTLVWICLVVPTVLWWSNSILWVLVMSIWANASTHWSAWQAARAERAQLDATVECQRPCCLTNGGC